jgi:hypothetical protein
MTIVDDKVCQEKLIKYVYRNDTLTFDHVLLPTLDKNTYIVIVVDLVVKIVKGYSRLDLNELYGLDCVFQ